MTKIVDTIRQMVKGEGDFEFNAIIGTVTSVDETQRICDVQPLMDDAAFLNVRLQGAEGLATGFVMIPKVDSYVIILPMDEFEACVVLTTEIDKILVDTELTQFNGGSLGGLINIEDLVSKLNNLENRVNLLGEYMKTHVHLDPVSGTTGIITPTPTYTNLGITDRDDLEDTKITH